MRVLHLTHAFVKREYLSTGFPPSYYIIKLKISNFHYRELKYDLIRMMGRVVGKAGNRFRKINIALYEKEHQENGIIPAIP